MLNFNVNLNVNLSERSDLIGFHKSLCYLVGCCDNCLIFRNGGLLPVSATDPNTHRQGASEC